MLGCLEPVDEGALAPTPRAAAGPSTTGGGGGGGAGGGGGTSTPPDAGIVDAGCACWGELLIFGGHQPWPTGTTGAGGANGSGDTWQIDLTTRQMSKVMVDARFPSPPPRLNHVAAWDAARQRMLIFGGATESFVPNDVWALEFQHPRPRWRRLATSGTPPLARQFASSAFDAVRGKWYVGFGVGALSEPARFSDCFVFDAATNSWSELTSPGGPSGRMQAALGVDLATGTLVVSGGLLEGGGVLRELWAWDSSASAPHWEPLTPSTLPMTHHSFFPDLTPMLISPGWTSATPFVRSNDVIRLTLEAPVRWQTIGTAPDSVSGKPVATVNGVGYVWPGTNAEPLQRFEVDRARWSPIQLTGTPEWLEGFSLVGR